MGKKKLPCFAATYSLSKSQVADALDKQADKAQLVRSSRKKRFDIYRDVAWPAIDVQRASYYNKIKSKKGKTNLYFAVEKADGSYVTADSDPAIAANVRRFLRHLVSRPADNGNTDIDEAGKQLHQHDDVPQKPVNARKQEANKRAGEIKLYKGEYEHGR